MLTVDPGRFKSINPVISLKRTNVCSFVLYAPMAGIGLLSIPAILNTFRHLLMSHYSLLMRHSENVLLFSCFTIQTADHTIRKDNLNCSFCLLSDMFIEPSGTPAFSFYGIDRVRNIANLPDSFHHYLDCLSIIGIVRFFDQLYLHPRLYEVVTTAIFCAGNCEIDFLHFSCPPRPCRHKYRNHKSLYVFRIFRFANCCLLYPEKPAGQLAQRHLIKSVSFQFPAFPLTARLFIL